MKTDHEMAACALQRVEEHRQRQERRKKHLLCTALPAAGGCLAVLLGVAFRQSGKPQHTATPPQQSVVGSTTTVQTANETSDRIVMNTLDSIGANKFLIELRDEDFVELSAAELTAYYGIDVFPDVPPDLVAWEWKEEECRLGEYGIFRENGGRGAVYWDQTVLNYSNGDYTRNVNMEIAKGRLPLIDYGVGEETGEPSVIAGNEVYLGWNAAGYYQAKFICQNTGFVLTADGLSQEEVVEVVRSIIR